MINWPTELIGTVARRKCVLFIGSGVSANAVGIDGKNPPTWWTFLNDALEQCDKPKRHISSHLNSGDLLSACELIKQRLDEEWVTFLRRQFVDPQFQPSKIHEIIFQLDSRIVVTPNFDKIYDRSAMDRSGGTVSIKSHNSSDIAEAVKGRGRYILKIHGDIDNASELIFTRKDYARARSKYRNTYKIIESLLLTHSFIFIGCGINDPDISLLLENYNFENNHAPPHYIILPGPIHDDDIRLLRETRNLKVIKYNKRDNHKMLVDSLEDLSKKVETSREQISRELDW